MGAMALLYNSQPTPPSSKIRMKPRAVLPHPVGCMKDTDFLVYSRAGIDGVPKVKFTRFYGRCTHSIYCAQNDESAQGGFDVHSCEALARCSRIRRGVGDRFYRSILTEGRVASYTLSL